MNSLTVFPLFWRTRPANDGVLNTTAPLLSLSLRLPRFLSLPPLVVKEGERKKAGDDHEMLFEGVPLSIQTAIAGLQRGGEEEEVEEEAKNPFLSPPSERLGQESAVKAKIFRRKNRAKKYEIMTLLLLFLSILLTSRLLCAILLLSVN